MQGRYTIVENTLYWYFFYCYCVLHLIYGCPWLQCFGGGVVGGVVASLQSLSMFPLSSQVIGSIALGPGVQPTGRFHAGVVWFSVNCWKPMTVLCTIFYLILWSSSTIKLFCLFVCFYVLFSLSNSKYVKTNNFLYHD